MIQKTTSPSKNRPNWTTSRSWTANCWIGTLARWRIPTSTLSWSPSFGKTKPRQNQTHTGVQRERNCWHDALESHKSRTQIALPDQTGTIYSSIGGREVPKINGSKPHTHTHVWHTLSWGTGWYKFMIIAHHFRRHPRNWSPTTSNDPWKRTGARARFINWKLDQIFN